MVKETTNRDELGDVIARLERRNRNLHRVNEVSQRLTSLLDEVDVMGYVVQASAEIIGAPVSSLWLWEDERLETLTCRATHPPETVEQLSQHRIRPDHGIGGWVAVNGKTAVTEDAYKDNRFAHEIDGETGFRTESMLAVPVILRDMVIGVIEILNKETADFDDEDVLMVETLAAAAAIALDNARLVGDLQTQNEELDAFAHTVAHDLKGPLTMVLGYSDMLEGDINDIDSAEVSLIASAVSRNARKMDSIIKEILLLSSVRKQAVTFQAVNMAEVVHEALHRIDHQVRETQAQIVSPTDWPTVCGYAPWIEEVWVNYISNAVKYGGRPPHVELGFDEQDDQVWFWVRDNGAGISAEAQRKLFVPFTRLEQVRVKGHGLGLSIVHRIVSKLDGQTAVESTVGQGSCFKFSLPRNF